MQYNFIEGELLLINKPLTWTSFNVVKKVRSLIQRKLDRKLKVGHAGTLDPLATGLLILCTGKSTKKISQYQCETKEYIATIKIGSTTPSYDLETEIDKTFPIDHITEEILTSTIKSFVREIQQIPPAFSAVWVDGKRAYKKARNGEVVELKPRNIEIFELDILSSFSDFPEVKLRIKCSKGTYIRSLAYDIGVALDSGAHLIALERTASGNFNLADAMTIEEFENSLQSEQ